MLRLHVFLYLYFCVYSPNPAIGCQKSKKRVVLLFNVYYLKLHCKNIHIYILNDG